jgi:hypothetical protein
LGEWDLCRDEVQEQKEIDRELKKKQAAGMI